MNILKAELISAKMGLKWQIIDTSYVEVLSKYANKKQEFELKFLYNNFLCFSRVENKLAFESRPRFGDKFCANSVSASHNNLNQLRKL